MVENKCCRYLKILQRDDTKEYKRYFCNTPLVLNKADKYLLNASVINNDWIKIFCMEDFKLCKYFPRG